MLLFCLGSVTSSDSGHSTQLDSHSNSSVDTAAIGPAGSPPLQHRRHSVMQPPGMMFSQYCFISILITLLVK